MGSNRLLVALADDVTERRIGLMGATDLGGLDGMLFIHDSVATVSYTMENTLLPLDLWFIDSGGVIVGTTEALPCETSSCESYVSPEPVAYVLETELGEFSFEIGDSVDFSDQ